MTTLQPFLHELTVLLRSPSQVWSAADGSIGDGPSPAIQGAWLGDTRYLSGWRLRVDGVAAEPVGAVALGPSATRFEGLLRQLDDPGADPDVRVAVRREVGVAGFVETVVISSRLTRAVTTRIELIGVPDDTTMGDARLGRTSGAIPAVTVEGDRARWDAADLTVTLRGEGATLRTGAEGISAGWSVVVPARGSVEVVLQVEVDQPDPVVVGVDTPAAFAVPDPAPADDRLTRWLTQGLADLDALRTRVRGHPDVFLAAGAPWYLTLFGRDSLWAARMLLPLDTGLEIAGGTLRTLARLQGTRTDVDTAEQPGKIMHELRQRPLVLESGGMLPPLYYGTIDATALWVVLLHEAWRWGLPEAEVRALLPHLEAALRWMREHGDADGDGLLEYVDESGRGLTNQGWKDSDDSVQARDGRLAHGPVALCEVQAYAHQAAVLGAELLEAFGRPDADISQVWADRLAERFRQTFWVADDRGRYPAIALDGAKRPMDSLTSNLGHLLGTGLLDAEEETLVADRLVDPALAAGFGLRTLSSDDAGFWALSYHGGSVWTHDTAIAVVGLARAGFAAQARTLAEGLLAAAPTFGYRMPELHGGDARADTPTPVPYPAACRPQAWSSAAAVAVWAALNGVEPPPG